MDYYEKNAPACTVNVLGTGYAIYLDVPESEDAALLLCDGFCDKTVKRIVICEKSESSDLADWKQYRNTCIRHELVHAFMFESGFSNNFRCDRTDEEHPELLVEWFAIQFPKMLKAFEEAGAL